MYHPETFRALKREQARAEHEALASLAGAENVLLNMAAKVQNNVTKLDGVGAAIGKDLHGLGNALGTAEKHFDDIAIGVWKGDLKGIGHIVEGDIHNLVGDRGMHVLTKQVSCLGSRT